MIILNNVKFVKDDNELANSLFTNKTASGYYKRYKRQIKLFDINQNLIGVIANNVLGKASKLENGKYWYSYGTIDLIGEYKSYSKYNDEIMSLKTGKDSKGYIYN